MPNLVNKFIREFNMIREEPDAERIDRYRGYRDFELLAGYRARLQHAADSVTYPLGTDSYDPTERYTFSDGSSLTLANPRQSAYAAFVSEG